MKTLFVILFTATLLTAGLMRWDAHRRAIEFNIMDFEWPRDRSNLDALIVEWSDNSSKRTLLLDQLGMDYIFMSLLFRQF